MCLSLNEKTTGHAKRKRKRLLVEVEDVGAVVFSSAVPVFVGFAAFGAEAFVEALARAGAGVAVDSAEVTGDAANEMSFEDATIALVFVFAEDGGGVAVDGMRIDGAAFGHFKFAVERDAVGFADELFVLEHPDGESVFQEMLFFGEGEAEIGVVFEFEVHGAGDGVVGAEGDGHGSWVGL